MKTEYFSNDFDRHDGRVRQLETIVTDLTTRDERRQRKVMQLEEQLIKAISDIEKLQIGFRQYVLNTNSKNDNPGLNGEDRVPWSGSNGIMDNTPPIDNEHKGTINSEHKTNNDHDGGRTNVDRIQHLRKLTNNGKAFSETQNASGYRVGDKVYVKDYKKAYNPYKKRQNKDWTALPGFIVGHTRDYVHVAVEPIEEDSTQQRIVRKSNNNVFKCS